MGKFTNGFKNLRNPKYDGIYLRSLIKKTVGDVRLSDTTTNLVVPVVDVDVGKPVFFSTNEAKKDPRKKASLLNLCLGTTAAPTYFPGHSFTDESGEEFNSADANEATGKSISGDDANKTQELNSVDGGLFANNPASIAVFDTLRDKVINENERADEIEVLVLSIGTGSDKMSKKASYRSENTSKAGCAGWVYNVETRSSPLFELIGDVNGHWPDTHLLGMGLFVEITNLRVQDEMLEPSVTSLDDSTKENMEKLKAVGERVCEKYDKEFWLIAKILAENYKSRRT